MKKHSLLVIAAALAVLLAGCYSGPKSGKGLHLPEGDIEKGKTAFLELRCSECHRVTGMSFPAPTSTVATNIVLGGKVNRIQTYGELVTAVVNPSHGFAAGFNKDLIGNGVTSPMPQINDRMTVTQLIDLVAFLQSRYELIEVSYNGRGKY